jgi:hypothetical protein
MRLSRIIGFVLLGLGLLVFLIRLHHPGAYWFPEQGNLRAALASLAIGAWLVAEWLPEHPSRRPLQITALLVTPIVLFFASYAILSEMEEVVVIVPSPEAEAQTPLRLWVMDDAGSEWVNMSRTKAQAAGLINSEVTFYRHGQSDCRRSTVVENRTIVARNSQLGLEKYTVKQFAVAIGVFSEVPPPAVISVRLDPCTR